MKKYISMLVFRPVSFFKELKYGNVNGLFPVLCVILGYLFHILVFGVFGKFVPKFLIVTKFEFIIGSFSSLIILPLLLIFLLKSSREKYLKINVFKTLYSIHLFGIIGNFIILILGFLNLLTDNICFFIFISISVWGFIISIIGIHVISGFSKVKTTVIYIVALVLVSVCSILIKGSYKIPKEMRQMNKEKPSINLAYYKAGYSREKILKYNMNPLMKEPKPINCITKDGKLLDVYIAIKFKLNKKMLPNLNKEFSDLDGNYEPEMNFQISDAVKSIISTKDTKGSALDIPLDKLESEIEKEVNNRLALMGIDLIDLKVQYENR